MKQQLLIVNATSQSNLSNFITAKNMNLFITVVGPELPEWLKNVVDHYIEADNYNIPQLVNMIETYHTSHKIDGVITFWDREVHSVAAICDKLHLPGSSPESVLNAKNKYRMRQALQKNNVPQPAFHYVKTKNDLLNAIRITAFPFILKPIAAAASQGVFLINDESEIDFAYQAIENAFRPSYWFHPHEYIAESYMVGTEYSIEGIVQKSDEIFFVGITSKQTTSQYFVEWQHCFPASINNQNAHLIYNISKKAIEALGLTHTAFHIEVMMTKSGPKIVEVNARLGGDFITSELIPLASGFSMAEAAIKTALGIKINVAPLPKSQVACIRYLVAHHEGKIHWKTPYAPTSSPQIIAFNLLKKENEFIFTPPKKFGENRICYVITKADSEEDAARLADTTLNKIHYVIKSPGEDR